MRRYLLFWILSTGIVIFSACKISRKERNPNIIFILTDDQAPWALGASGDPNASTPNMDRLAREGAYFKNAFITTPVCSPSRASIMTSRYASEYNILDFIPNPSHRLYDESYNAGLAPESVTFAEVLQEAGYKTGLVGKWHLGDWTLTDDKKYHPTNHGFDYFAGLTGGGTTPSDPPLEIKGEIVQFTGLTTDILTDHAIEFIKTNSEHPFLLCLNTRAPHGAWLPVADEDWAPFDGMDPVLPDPDYPDLNTERAKSRMREYLASTRGVDRNLGRIVELLDDLRLRDNTIIIFFSDHGYNMGHNGIEHKGNGIWITRHLPPDTENISGKYRPNMYDNSLKVPAIIRWPGVISPGTVIHHTITSLDLFPSIVAMAGAALPDDHIVRGRSFVPLLTGEGVKTWDDDYYGEYSMINYCNAYMRCYRTPEWKLVRDFLNPERDELYNLVEDPQESNNLIMDPGEEIKEISEELHQKIIKQMEELNDPLLNEQDIDKYYYRK
jgi:arylsulfatase A-like enzyme